MISLSSLLLIISCGNPSAEWLEQYKTLHCQYQLTQRKMEQAIQQLNAPADPKTGFPNSPAFTSYNNKIASLQSQIKKAEKDYKEQYDAETMKQSVAHGHVSTPDYESRLKALEHTRDRNIGSYENEIAQVKEQMDNDPEVKKNLENLHALEASKKNKEADVRKVFEKQLDSLQQELNNHNSKFKDILYELKKPDADRLKAQRDSIKLSSCNE
jgi:hypothetical protein